MRRRLAVAAGAIAVASGCTSFGTLQTAAPPNGPLPALLPVERFEMADYKGKVLVLVFWAEWCDHCTAMFPWLVELSRGLPANDGAVVGIIEDDGADTMPAAQAFLVQAQAGFQNFHETSASVNQVAKRYRVIALPSMLVFDRGGTLREHFVGNQPELASERRAAIHALLR